MEGRSFSIHLRPEVGVGYFRVSEIFQSQNNSFVLKRSLVMIKPRLNFSFLIRKFSN